MAQRDWESKVKAKRARLEQSIPEAWRFSDLDRQIHARSRTVVSVPRQYLTGDEITITESPPTLILENIRCRVWTSCQVVDAFCHRAAISHQLSHCLTEILFNEAMATARELDLFQSTTGYIKGPLHGLPISFMDRFRVAGAETATGFVAWLGNVETADSESLIVKQMRLLGAVPFCKTTVPQSLLLGETANNITGSTTNPFVRHLSSGGAAGGEGTLLALRGSCVGWGTEIAGSTRIPAAYSMTYALRPCAGRTTSKGVAGVSPATPVCAAVTAPMSNDLDMLKLICKTTMSIPPSLEDPGVLNLPWREAEYLRYLPSAGYMPKFGIMYDDSHVRPHPPIQRALSTLHSALTLAGFEVTPWSPPAHQPAVQTLFRILGADGLAGVRTTLDASGEPPVSQLRAWYAATNTGTMPVADFWNLCSKRAKYRTQYNDYWNSQNVDAVILPVAPTASAEPDKATYFGYTAIANFLDVTAGCFPVLLADSELDMLGPAEPPYSDEDRRIRDMYDRTLFHGAPVALQVMCRGLEEEKCLALMAVVKNALDAQGNLLLS